MITYREAKKTDEKAIVTLLNDAFMDYPYYKLYVPDEARRQQFVRAIQALCVRISFIKKYPILVGVLEEKIVSVAILVPPNAEKISLIDYLLNGGLSVLYHGGIKDTIGFLKMFEESNAACHQAYPNAWVMELFAVSDSCQGQGVGGNMLNDYVKTFIASKGGGQLTFITNTELNRRFYTKNGFTEFDERDIHRRDKVLGNWSYQVEISPTLKK